MFPTDGLRNGRTEQGGTFSIEGRVHLEGNENRGDDITLTAYAFDRLGQVLGTGEVNTDGVFRIEFAHPVMPDVELIVGPAADGDPQAARRSSAFSRSFGRKDWRGGDAGAFQLNPEVVVPADIWFPWRPVRVCVSGHVRKITHADASPGIEPVPFVKVEVFDVDREPCWWPHIDRWWDRLLDRAVIRVPELLRERPPVPPDPIGPVAASRVANLAGVAALVHPGEARGFNPQPDPPRVLRPGDRVSLNPQPLPPRLTVGLNAQRDLPVLVGRSLSDKDALQFDPQPDPPATAEPSLARSQRVGEAGRIAPEIASRLENLTLTSKVEPWRIFPRCFYSKQEVAETFTDCDGYFRCCFRWPRFHFRRGRLRFDARPDIILRVTQTVGGVDNVIYLDPYTSTRWDTTNAHIDLYLDDEEIRTGGGCPGTQPTGAATFWTRVGLDEVYKIDQTNGTYSDMGFENQFSNAAYGGSLHLYGQFGTALTAGTPKRYYRISYRNGPAGAFVPITASLSDTRVNKTTFDSTEHVLGPQVVNGSANLYEIRDMSAYYWYNPDWIGVWDSEAVEADEGLYTLRLEVFDENGVKLTSADVAYLDGTDAPPGPLPALTDACDLKIRIDNKLPVLDLQIPAAGGECGVVPFSAAATLSLDAHVSQENNRLYSWGLSYVKGLTGAAVGLADATSGSGLAVPVNQSVSGAPLTAGLASTCAFSLTLGAWPLVRNGFGFIHHASQTKAIAIEKCS